MHVTPKTIVGVALAAVLFAAGLIAFSEWDSRPDWMTPPERELGDDGSQAAQADPVPTEPPEQTEPPTASTDVAPVAGERVQTATTELGDAPPLEALPADPLKGDPAAPVKIIEFAEFYCPYCARHVWQTIPQLEQAYIDEGLVQYEFRNLPVHGFVAVLASVAGECAHEQGLFWPYHDLLFERVFPGRNLSSQDPMDLAKLKAVAADVGADVARFDACLDGYDARYQACLGEYNACEGDACEDAFNACMGEDPLFQTVLEDRSELTRLLAALPPEEQGQASRIGTPTFFINGRILIGAHPFSKFQQVIDAELEQTSEEEQ